MGPNPGITRRLASVTSKTRFKMRLRIIPLVVALCASNPLFSSVFEGDANVLELTTTGGGNNAAPFKVVGTGRDFRGRQARFRVFIKDATDVRAPVPQVARSSVEDCVRSWVNSDYYRIKVGWFPASPEGAGFGLDSQGEKASSYGLMTFREGEILRITNIVSSSFGSHGSISVMMISLLEHDVETDFNAFPLQSSRPLLSLLNVPIEMSCEAFEEAWGVLFKPADADSLRVWSARHPSGVLVDELRKGTTSKEVRALLGALEKRGMISGKTIYWYPVMKISFRHGKLVDLQLR